MRCVTGFSHRFIDDEIATEMSVRRTQCIVGAAPRRQAAPFRGHHMSFLHVPLIRFFALGDDGLPPPLLAALRALVDVGFPIVRDAFGDKAPGDVAWPG